MRPHAPKRAFSVSLTTQFAMLLLAIVASLSTPALARQGRVLAQARVLRTAGPVGTDAVAIDDGSYLTRVEVSQTADGRPVVQVEWVAN